MINRVDGWASTTSALGSIKDKSTGTRPVYRRRLTRAQLVALHDQNAIAGRVVNKIVADAFSTPWTIKAADADDAAVLEHREYCDSALQLTKQTANAVTWSRLYGACALVFSVQDGRKPHEPIDVANMRQIYRPTPISSPDLLPLTYDSAFGSPTYRDLLTFRINSLGANGMHDVHHSRLWLFEPISLPLEERIMSLGGGTNGLGPSVLEPVYDELAADGGARQSAAALLYTASLMFVKLQGLAKSITTEAGKIEVRKQLETLREAWDSFGLLGLDPGDDVGTVERSLSGASDLLAASRDALGSALPMPREIGLNESETGIRGGELSGVRALWNATVSSYRRTVIGPALRHQVMMSAIQRRVPIGDFEIAWDPLWEPDEKELSDTAAKNAETDRRYVDMGAISAHEVRAGRFVEGARGALTVGAESASNVQDRGLWLGPAIEIVKAVHAGDMPRTAGTQLLIAGGFSPLLLGTAGESALEAGAEAEALRASMPEDATPIEAAAAQIGMKTATLTAAVRRGELQVYQVGARRSVSLSAAWALAVGGPPAPALPEPAPEAA